MRYRERECDRCDFRAKLPSRLIVDLGEAGPDFVGWGTHKCYDLCPKCDTKYVDLEREMDHKTNEALVKFLKL